ncbi:histidine--tRNA ligase [Oceanobacillus picturae]|uniref:Histidine--tRNA ligase n=1 Tax=Oceanobacillus picturae TaxID=171693 RepID=W9A8F3_9BACI|nr:histidine--tRNA ligase [Oceanobacillus picturae]RIU93644.1 histidine--tRNA ligase [Oceanobacillus picturae]GAQ16690.1 histidine--tRNA ligase [Oceanobacillus picturae]CDO01773.1 Histidine--tRNA ligase [Oceanobacillus picturae]
MNMKAPRGTVDLLPENTRKWQYAEKKIKDICDRYNFNEIRTPVFEHTELFQRGVGDSTDIVQKEMYTFKDRGGRSLTLRPEGTASVARAYVENKLFGTPIQPTKLYYFAPMFRYERPQKGRMRQLNQFGVEVLGSADPAVDAEVIDLAMTCYKEVGLTSLKLVINSLGDSESRDNHRRALVEHFSPVKEELCSDCQIRLEQNPLRILDCKKDREHPAMKNAPSILDYLNDESKNYFERVKSYLTMMGIEYEVDKNLVRGLDYYNHTAFEIMSEAEGFGAITTLAGGGRYNGLVEELGGPDTPGIGFGMGFERLLMALEAENKQVAIEEQLDCYVVAMGDQAEKESVKILHELRAVGIQADKDYLGRKMKAQFKSADRFNSSYVLVLGDEELEKQMINVKNLETGDQIEVKLQEVVSYMKETLQGGKGNE